MCKKAESFYRNTFFIKISTRWPYQNNHVASSYRRIFTKCGSFKDPIKRIFAQYISLLKTVMTFPILALSGKSTLDCMEESSNPYVYLPVSESLRLCLYRVTIYLSTEIWEFSNKNSHSFLNRVILKKAKAWEIKTLIGIMCLYTQAYIEPKLISFVKRKTQTANGNFMLIQNFS